MVIINLPLRGFDPTETAIPWYFLSKANIPVTFATPNGQPAYADERMTCQGLGLLSPFLMTRKNVLQKYKEMTCTKEFQHPHSYQEIDTNSIWGMVFPGGHGEGIKSMLESTVLYQKIVECFDQNKVIAALCTGVLTVARSIDPKTQKSVLFDRKTTAVTRWMELSGWYLTHHFFNDYYRIYPITAQDEIQQLLKKTNQFFTGKARVFPMQFTNNFLYSQFTVQDGNYLSARWPGDCYRFALELVHLVQKQQEQLRG
ncbi:type 1 glutamine amidotransferase domain-containing protein [Legionella lytica]|uniref:Type 1 glutamine amidotransferase domain-containing protein n=1 Tax=Legionella lytica TaxID=96232 RepID=A0ABW8D6A4_9GAMM